MGKYNFNEDLTDSEEVVDNFKKLLDDLGYKTIKAEGYFPDWDVSAEHPSSGRILTFELKFDEMAGDTGNIAIEYECRGKPSGISITKADYWVHYSEGVYYIVKISELKKKLNNIAFLNVTGGDAGSNTKMHLIKIEKFKSICDMKI